MSDDKGQLKLQLGTEPDSPPADQLQKSPSRQAPAARATKARQQAQTVAAKRTQPTNEVDIMQETAKPADFETMIAELEKVVTSLEGELKLEQALALFERGLGLSRQCEQFLKVAQQRIEILKKTADGEVLAEPFKEQAEAGA